MKGLSSLVCMLACLLVTAPLAAQDDQTPADPWEGFNRKIHNFNDAADRWVMKPVARGYVTITPDPVEQGVSNFFDNLLEIRNVLNDVLQGKWKRAGKDTGRFLVNSTIGIVGIFDVAQFMKMERGEGEDFGQTLAVWGVGSGPYVVLPFLGPSTLRDTAALPVDWYSSPLGEHDNISLRNTLRALSFVDTRARLLDAEGFISGDRYVFLREAYLQRRDYLINDGVVSDSFDDFGDFGDDDYYDSDYD